MELSVIYCFAPYVFVLIKIILQYFINTALFWTISEKPPNDLVF